jgi:O-acetylhomoserine/O-acetylserine sulfhydrylase-like pyridoxal-dependent enzyme
LSPSTTSYGGTYRLFSKVYEPKGYAFEFVPPSELAAAIDERTRSSGSRRRRTRC